MITTEVLAKRKTRKNTVCSLEKIINQGNERFFVKEEGNILWYFTTKYEKEDGSFECIEPPYGIGDTNYELAIDTIMKFLKIA